MPGLTSPRSILRGNGICVRCRQRPGNTNSSGLAHWKDWWKEKVQVLLTSVEALMQPVLPPQRLNQLVFTLSSGDSMEPQALAQKLVNAGYSRAVQVEGPGQFALRGGILDVFCPGRSEPVRIEFWGDEIDTLTSFDPETQRRTDPVDTLTVTPALEAICPDKEALAKQLIQMSKKCRDQKQKQRLEEDAALLEAEDGSLNLDKYQPLWEQPAGLWDYFPADSLVLCSDLAGIRARGKGVHQQYQEDVKLLLEEGELSKGIEGQLFFLFSGLSLWKSVRWLCWRLFPGVIRI